MMETNTVIGIIVVVLTFVGYIPYVRDILRGKTKPHVFSWFIWGITTLIIYALQVSAGAGSGAWMTLAVALITFLIFFLSIRNGDRNIKKIDVVFLVVSILALILWKTVNQPVLSIILLSAVDLIGFAPTIRKSWNAPHSETLSLYVISAFRHSLSIFALQNYSIVTWLFPASWVLVNFFFAILLITRRREKPLS